MEPQFPEIHETDSNNVTQSHANTSLTGKRRKRQWFESKYSQNGESQREFASGTICKFYASTGTCRNGARCKFTHNESDAPRKIKEPCKFLYTSLSGCQKGDSCHFSHILADYPCPLAFGSTSPRCPRNCEFSHEPLITEKAYFDFSRLYRVYLLSLPPHMLHPRWRFYLDDEDEKAFLDRTTRSSSTNLFDQPVGSLVSLPRTLNHS